MIYTILFNIFVVLITASVAVLTYCIRSRKGEFDIISFFLTNKTRFIVGSLIGILVSILVVVSPDVEAILKLIGFDGNRTPVSIGLALSVILIAGVDGNKTS